MIDIVFLLLVFFIVTQKEIVADTYLKTNLPGRPDPTKIVPPRGPLFTISVDLRHPEDPARDLEVFQVNGRTWQFADLRRQLLQTGRLNPDTTIVISCDPNAKHRKLVKLLDACAEARLSNLNLFSDASVPFTPVNWPDYYRRD